MIWCSMKNIHIQDVYKNNENLLKKDMILYKSHPIIYTTRNLTGAPERNKGWEAISTV